MLNLTRPRPTGSHKAFTLIELLVVIAIIAILASILFPVFARARENARRSSCMSNLKQIGLGVLQYTQDFDERLPRSIADGNPRPASDTVFFQISPYIKSEQIFRCPSDSSPTGAQNYSYGYNYRYLGFGPFSDLAISIAALQEPSLTVMMTDKISIPGDVIDWIYAPASWNRGGSDPENGGAANTSGWVSKRHLDGTNALWADGHVKWHRLESLVAPVGCTGDACNSLWDLN
jgi:prepilin-type N-terminal cleavage/methylation domain-containing protein/prepilin-type processing-associated H-X9-DG protein